MTAAVDSSVAHTRAMIFSGLLLIMSSLLVIGRWATDNRILGTHVGALICRIVRHLDRDTLRKHHIDRAAGVDFDHRESLLSKRDVVLRQTIHGAAHAGAQTGLQFLAVGDGADCTQR